MNPCIRVCIALCTVFKHRIALLDVKYETCYFRRENVCKLTNKEKPIIRHMTNYKYNFHKRQELAYHLSICLKPLLADMENIISTILDRPPTKVSM